MINWNELFWFILVVVVAISIGLSWKAKGVEMKCNDFIFDTYVNLTYDECLYRCEAKKPLYTDSLAFNFSIEINKS